ncbi:MAG: Druantia anti-phage system protein DruA [Leptospirales bacterium]
MKIFGQTLDTIRTEAASAVSRSALARKVCELLGGGKGASGKPKEMNARLLLNTLEKTWEVALPPSCGPVPGWRPPEETDPLWKTMAEPFDGALSELGPIEIVRVAAKEESRLWNALFSRYHCLGKGPLCGAQIRYLAKSPVLGYVGGAAFSSPSWKVAARDLRIGWNEEGRQKFRVGRSGFRNLDDHPGPADFFRFLEQSLQNL